MTKDPIVKHYIITHIITLIKNMDVYFTIGLLLKNKISGEQEIDQENNLCGILSEKDCLLTFVNGFFYNMPGVPVFQFMTTFVSTVTPNTELFSAADLFLKNNFHRMPVISGKKLVGQIIRRNILRAIHDSINYDMNSKEINGI